MCKEYYQRALSNGLKRIINTVHGTLWNDDYAIATNAVVTAAIPIIDDDNNDAEDTVTLTLLLTASVAVAAAASVAAAAASAASVT